MGTADAATWWLTMGVLLGISMVSVVGAAGLLLRPAALRGVMVLLIPFAAGALLGDSFLHLLPEVAEQEPGLDVTASMSVLAGIVTFFILEKVLHWHHSHLPHEDVLHPVAISNLMGDGLHNFIDGAIVAGAFLVSNDLGFATALAVALHELPQELGDFGILVHAGLSPRSAVKVNFLTALSALAGGALTLALTSFSGTLRALVPFAAGAFIYIASTDLIPELHKEPEPKKSLLQVFALVAGVGVMASLLVIDG